MLEVQLQENETFIKSEPPGARLPRPCFDPALSQAETLPLLCYYVKWLKYTLKVFIIKYLPTRIGVEENSNATT